LHIQHSHRRRRRSHHHHHLVGYECADIKNMKNGSFYATNAAAAAAADVDAFLTPLSARERNM
jgi:Fe2+ or Zn2+ uptake regulation protein